jgi:hypothetical protein
VENIFSPMRFRLIQVSLYLDSAIIILKLNFINKLKEWKFEILAAVTMTIYCLMGCDNLQCGGQVRTSQGNMLPPF